MRPKKIIYKNIKNNPINKVSVKPIEIISEPVSEIDDFEREYQEFIMKLKNEQPVDSLLSYILELMNE